MDPIVERVAILVEEAKDAHEREPTMEAARNKVKFVNSSMRINVENAFIKMLGLYSIVVLDVSARLREESKVEMIL